MARKTPAEKFEEAKLHMEKMAAKMARDANKNNPEYLALLEKIETMAKDIAGYSRKTTGPNSFANRIAVAKIKIDWIEAEERLVIAQDASAKEQKKFLQNALAKVTTENVAKLKSATVVKKMPKNGDLAELQAEYDRLNQQWRGMTPKAIKASEDAAKVTEIDMSEIEQEATESAEVAEVESLETAE